MNLFGLSITMAGRNGKHVKTLDCLRAQERIEKIIENNIEMTRNEIKALGVSIDNQLKLVVELIKKE